MWLSRSNGYPLDYEKGVKLPAKTEGDIITYYAGAKFAENSRALLSNGGRVYMLVTTADTVKETQDTIYQELAQQKQKASFTEKISEVKLFDKGIRKSDAVVKYVNSRLICER